MAGNCSPVLPHPSLLKNVMQALMTSLRKVFKNISLYREGKLLNANRVQNMTTRQRGAVGKDWKRTLKHENRNVGMARLYLMNFFGVFIIF